MERSKATRAAMWDTDDTDSEKSDSTLKASPQPEPRYLYYRLFTENIRIPSKHPAYPSNSYIGRVKANSIAPPLTVLMIKRRICKVENISDYPSSILFLSGSSRSPTDDGDRAPILTPGGPGSTLEEPIELVVTLSSHETSEIDKLKANSVCSNPQYIYYNLYAEDGEISVKHPINSHADSHSLARIDINLVPPPHTVNSIIRCISYVEGFPFCFWHQLFLEHTSELPYKYNDTFNLTSEGPGFMPERPLAFVQSAGMKRTMNAKPVTSSLVGLLDTTNKFHKLYTDGVVRQEALIPGGFKYDVYRARNNSGQHGFVLKDDVTLHDYDRWSEFEF